MLINRFAICTNTLPTTCFETSKDQILIGLCGRSRHRLYTSARRAKQPKAPCTKMAKGPRRRHSPLSGSFGEEEMAVAVERTAEVMVGKSTPREWREVAVAIASERRDVGVASWRREASEGSKPGGGSIKILCPCRCLCIRGLRQQGVWDVRVEGYKAVIRDCIASPV